MKKVVMKNNRGFTLMELLLVVATLAIVATVGMPYMSEAYYSMHDGTAESMVTNLISSAKSRAIAGRIDENTIKFKTDGTIEVGSNTYKLPSNFEITTAAEYTFDLKGNVSPSNGSVTIRRRGYSRTINVR